MRSHLQATLWCVWKCLRGFQQCQKDGNTDIVNQPCYGQLRTAATEHNKQKVDKLIR